jgi:hypothetical protein
MALTSPDWLTRHGGALQERPGGGAWLVLFHDQPQYLLTPVPVAGKFGCAIMQTINGRRVDSRAVAATPEEAVKAGLEDLRKALGW